MGYTSRTYVGHTRSETHKVGHTRSGIHGLGHGIHGVGHTEQNIGVEHTQKWDTNDVEYTWSGTQSRTHTE